MAKSLGSAFLVTFFWRSKESYCHCGTDAAGTQTNLAKNTFGWHRFVAGHYRPTGFYDPGRASLLRATDYLQLTNARRPISSALSSIGRCTMAANTP